MRTLTTSKGKTHQINWHSTRVTDGELWINMTYSGRLPDIAGDFDQCETFTLTDKEGTVECSNYTRLTHLLCDGGDNLTIRIALNKTENN